MWLAEHPFWGGLFLLLFVVFGFLTVMVLAAMVGPVWTQRRAIRGHQPCSYRKVVGEWCPKKAVWKTPNGYVCERHSQIPDRYDGTWYRLPVHILEDR